MMSNNNEEDQLIKLSNSAPSGKKIYLLIDEVQNGTQSALWSYLLKTDSHSIISIGVGVPYLNATSPAFPERLPSDHLFVKEYELNEDVVDSFVAISQIKNKNKNKNKMDENTVLRALKWARNFTAGHGYSFAKIAEYLVTECQDMCKSGFFQMSSQFIHSKAYKDILSRSFDLNTEEKACINAIAHNVKRGTSKILNAERCLDMIGVWNRDNAWFVSNLYYTFVLNTVLRSYVIDSTATDLKLGQADSMEQMLLYALGNLQARDLLIFKNPDKAHFRIENGIGSMLGNRLIEIPHLFVSPQTPVHEHKVMQPKHGMRPTIDFYLNGRMNKYLELTRNGSNLKEHFDKFERQDGPYHEHKEKYVILDFQLQSDKPTSVPEEYQHCRNNFYCYVLMRNSLYKNGQLVKEKVSCNIASPKRLHDPITQLKSKSESNQSQSLKTKKQDEMYD
jgi:hypothetical protein